MKMNKPSGADMKLALGGLRQQILDIPLENISNIAKQAFGSSDILPLWFGEGDVPTPPFIAAAAKKAIDEGHFFYTHQNGIPEFRATVADYLTGLYSKTVTADRITLTSGGMPAIMLAVQALVNEGDNVIVIDPVWPNIGGFTRIAGGIVRSVRMDLTEAGWVLDMNKVAAAADSRTRVIFFASPGNPTGAMLPVETQKEMLAFCRPRGIWIISDEVYGRMVFGQSTADSFIDISEPEDRVLIINSFSKSWAMTGWRLGWLTHPPSLGPTFAMMTQYTTSGTTTFLHHAAIAAIKGGEPFVKEIRDYSRQGMEIVCDALEKMSRVKLKRRPEAAMYVFFEIDGMKDSKAAVLDILDKTKVGLAPGIFFGKGSESFLRLCFCRAPDTLHLAMERLKPMLS
jgi:aspartate/methionine/tyrosine aminotransferase